MLTLLPVLVPLALFSLALGVFLLGPPLARRRRARAAAKPASKPELLIHAINDDRCTGCEACVNVCPTDVLDLIANKSRVLRFSDCIQCEMCQVVCPTQALVMHPESGSPPPILLPNLDSYYQTNVAGMYLIGEASGKPLCKNASNLGRAVIEHMRSEGLTAHHKHDPSYVDVVIIGSGPGGLSAALSCIQHGYSYAVLEKEQIPCSTVARYPKGKDVMAEPYDCRSLGLLPVWDATKEEIVPAWKQIVSDAGVQISTSELVERVAKSGDGTFETATARRKLRSQRVVLATGTRGKPRKLGVAGETLPKVANMLDDPEALAGRDVLIVGGGDSAAEAVLALCAAGARVTLSYRGKQLARVNSKNRDKVEKLIAARKLSVVWGSNVVEIKDRHVKLKVESGQQKEIVNDSVILLIGADPPVAWLRQMGIDYVERPHGHAQPRSDVLVERLLGEGLPEVTMQNALELVFGREARPRIEWSQRRREAPVLPLPKRRPKAAPAPWFRMPRRPAAAASETPALELRAALDTDEPVTSVAIQRRGPIEHLPDIAPGRPRLPPSLPLKRPPPTTRSSQLADAARVARARAYANGEIRVPPEEERTKLVEDEMLDRLRRHTRGADDLPAVLLGPEIDGPDLDDDDPLAGPELDGTPAPAPEDGETRVLGPTGAWRGLVRLKG